MQQFGCDEAEQFFGTRPFLRNAADFLAGRATAGGIVLRKRWQSWLVDVDEIRRFAGLCCGRTCLAMPAIFRTLSSFTSQAEQEAKTLWLTLIDGRELHDRRQRVPITT